MKGHTSRTHCVLTVSRLKSNKTIRSWFITGPAGELFHILEWWQSLIPSERDQEAAAPHIMETFPEP